MRIFSRLHTKSYCAFCRSPRRVYAKKHVDLTNVLGAAMLSAGLAVALFGEFNPRSLLFFCLVVGLSELFVYLRWRLAIVCKLCGFDPVLYKRSPDAAAKRVRAFFEEQIQNPAFHLSKSPLLAIYRKQVATERKKMELRNRVGAAKLPMIEP
ncbi:MAG: hypothetical protein AB7F86_20115 [Bdellovibrionales bacterium]